MPGLSHLRDVYDKRGKDFLEGLLNKTVIVNEKMDGAFFGAQKNEGTGKFRFFKRNAEISYVDRVLSKYYEPAILHFENLGDDIISQVPANYLFGMEWFTSPKAQTITYDRLPKNGLILSYIHVMDEKGGLQETIQEKEQLDGWADALDIERPPIVFQGKLSDEQKQSILEFVYTPFEDLASKFKTVSFTRYIMSVLNPEARTTFLRDALDKDIEGLVFRFYDPESSDEDSVFLAKLVDPVFQQGAKQKAQDRVQKKSDDYIWIIAIDLMNFIERYSASELGQIELDGSTYEEKYISLINRVYLDFISEFGDKYADLDIQIPEFLTREEFGVNFDLVKNERVIKLVNANPNYKEIYRILLNIFRKKKIKVGSSLFTKQMKDNLNSQIDKINRVVMGDTVFENYFPTFNEFVGQESEPGYFESFAEVPENDRSVKRVNLIVSDFQPIHAGHLKFAQRLSEESGFPCLFVCVNNGTSSRLKPIRRETLDTCLKKVADQNPGIVVGHRMIGDGEIESILEAVKPMFEPVSLAATKSRVKDLAMQLELAKKRSRNLNFKKGFRLIEIPTALNKDAIMDSIRSGNYSEFKANTPSSIHSEFFNLNRDLLEKLNESVEAAEVAEPEVDQSAAELIDMIPNLDQAFIRAILSRAKNYLRKSNKSISQILKEKGLPPNSVKAIVHDLRETGEENEFLDYLENPTVTLAELKVKTSLTDLFSEIRLSDALKKEILVLVDTRSNVAIGPGEIPIAVFVKDAKVNTQDTNGDIRVGELLLEIKMSSNKSGAQLASSNYSSRAKKEALFKTAAGLAMVDKYGLSVKTGGAWPNMLASISPGSDNEAREFAYRFLDGMYPGLFKSADEIDWANGETINKSVGLALGMDYLKSLDASKVLMFIAADRNSYRFIESVEIFKQLVEAGEIAFRIASDTVPRCNFIKKSAGIEESFEDWYGEEAGDEQ
jgi:hypothetical protein